MRCIIVALLLLLSENVHAFSDTDCMALIVNREARGEPLAGKRAVMDVILNRMHIRGMDACSIMRQKGQFSWYRRGMKLKMDIKALTDLIETDNMPSVLPNTAEYFHNKHVKPSWSRRLKKVATIGNHVFFSDRRKL